MSKETSLSTCNHKTLTFDPSPHAAEVGYKFRTLSSRIKAATLPYNTITKPRKIPSPSSFPAPLVFPNDELAYDPKCPGQGVASWLKLDSRNPITKDKSVVYVAASPEVDDDVAFVKSWICPSRKEKSDGSGLYIQRPTTSDILDYLAAFYHGIPVKAFPTTLRFTSWQDSEPGHLQKNNRQYSKKSKARGAPAKDYIALTTRTESVRISCRRCPDKTFPSQINLNDLLDAAESMLPSDAYALLLIVDHDLFEDEDDDFACGRAYGGSRISVVSTARYNPILDEELGMDRSHSWPASHCREFVTDICHSAEGTGTTMRKRKTKGGSDDIGLQEPAVMESPMHRAVYAHSHLPPLSTIGDTTRHPSTVFNALSGLWLGRVCRTASHELGHCFGLEHCVYYACVMQGTASILEDERQPLYLCPVDLAKILYVTGKDILEYYKVLLNYCNKHSEAHIFAAYGEWIKGRLEELSEYS